MTIYLASTLLFAVHAAAATTTITVNHDAHANYVAGIYPSYEPEAVEAVTAPADTMAPSKSVDRMPPSSSAAFYAQPVHDPVSAVQGLISRMLPGHEAQFELATCAPKTKGGGFGDDAWEIHPGSQHGDTTVLLKGSSGVALASALNWYLKYYTNSSITWGDRNTGTHLDLPAAGQPLPQPDAPLRKTRTSKYSYAWNVCTVDYSAAFWTWDQYQWTIDFWALNGVNLPLSFTGQEHIWAQVYLEIGLNETEVTNHFTGPAFLAWGRMGNIHSFAGPLGPAWRASRAQLQSKIAARQRAFGMKGVLPAFAGHVPAAIRRLTPNVTRSADWCNFPSNCGSTYLLEQSDPLFAKIGSRFIELAAQAFGTDHIYNGDTFNEMVPSKSDPSYVADWGAAVYDAIHAADPDGVWLAQGWLWERAEQPGDFWTLELVEAYLSKVPDDGMIVLDLNSYSNPVWKRVKSYFGKSFIWCAIVIFGGRRDIYGDLGRVASGPAAALADPTSSMNGIGFTPEAIHSNPVVFDLLLENAWRAEPVTDVLGWTLGYARRRYGAANAAAAAHIDAAWTVMQRTVYAANAPLHSPIETVPTLTPAAHHNATAISEAWRHLALALGADASLADVGPFAYDLVDLSRQMLTNYFIDLVTSLAAVFNGPHCNGAGFADTFTLRKDTDSATGLKRACSLPQTGCGDKPSGCNVTAIKEACLRTYGCVGFNSNGWLKSSVGTTHTCMGTGLYVRDRAPAPGPGGDACVKSVTALHNALDTVLKDLDALMATNTNFLLGKWIVDAKALPEAVPGLNEYNARNQLTSWGPTMQINDYASKTWSGLVSDYYAPRWNVLLDAVAAAAKTGAPVDNNAVNDQVRALELAFSNQTKSYPTTTSGDITTASTDLLADYGGGGEPWAKLHFEARAGVAAAPALRYATLHTRDVGQLAALCLADPNCGAFGSTGALAMNATKTVAAPGATLYVRV